MSLIKEFQNVCESYEFMGSDPVVTEHTYYQEIIGRRKGWTDEFALTRIELPTEVGTQDLYLFVHHCIDYMARVSHQHSMHVQVYEGYTAEFDELLMYVHEFADNFPDTHNTGVEFAS